jgi:hypothetical protein
MLRPLAATAVADWQLVRGRDAHSVSRLARSHLGRASRFSHKGGASSKGHFRRKYIFARPKYTAEKLQKIREVALLVSRMYSSPWMNRLVTIPTRPPGAAQVIHKRRKEEIEKEKEKQRKEQEEVASREANLGKRKQLEEEEAKSQRLMELKAKAEALRQEKSTLFGILKQALIEEAKKKQREEKAERLRKEEQDKKDKKERAMAEAAQALAGASVHASHSGINPMLAGKMGQMGGMGPGMVGVGGVPGIMGYGHQTHGSPFLSPRQGFYGAQDSPRGVAPQGAAPQAGSAGRLQPFPPSQPPHGAPGYGTPSVGGVARSMMSSLPGQSQRFMNMQAYSGQNALLAGGRMAGGAMGAARSSDNRPPPPPSAPPPLDGQQQGQQPGQQSQAQGLQGGRGRGMFYPGGRAGFGAYQQQDRRW